MTCNTIQFISEICKKIISLLEKIKWVFTSKKPRGHPIQSMKIFAEADDTKRKPIRYDTKRWQAGPTMEFPSLFGVVTEE